MSSYEPDDRPPAPEQPAPAPAPQWRAPARRLGGLWLALASGAVVLLFLLIFILQNGADVDISYLGAHGTLPLGVALLLSAVFGVLLVVIPGAGRILQLRRAARRHPAPPLPPGHPQ